MKLIKRSLYLDKLVSVKDIPDIKVITGMACFTLFHILSYAQQSYYAEGTWWTELRLDTLKYNSWFTELREGGSTSYIPNYVRTDFYVKGDTTYMNSKYMKV